MYGNNPVPVVAFVIAFWAGTAALTYGVLRLVAWVSSGLSEGTLVKTWGRVASLALPIGLLRSASMS
jgi:hypothetical protein